MNQIMLLSQAVENLVPAGSVWSVRSVDDVSCENEADVPTKVAIEAEMNRLQLEYDALKFSRDRELAYDSVGNQLDMLMKDMRDGTTTHQESCEAVKAKFPK